MRNQKQKWKWSARLAASTLVGGIVTNKTILVEVKAWKWKCESGSVEVEAAEVTLKSTTSASLVFR